VAFLLAALQSVNLTELLTRKNVTVVRNDSSGQTLIVKQGDQLKTVHLSRQTVTGAGERVGDVFRLADGRLVYVQRAPASSATPPATTAPTTTTP
jgi:hypothetical protein